LVGDVMDGEQGPDTLPTWKAATFLLEIDRDQACLPVVGVEDVGSPIEQAKGLYHRPAEENEALAIIGIIALQPATGRELIEAASLNGVIALEVLCLLDKINRRRRVRQLGFPK